MTVAFARKTHSPPRAEFCIGYWVSRKDERDSTGRTTGKEYRVEERKYDEELKHWAYALGEKEGAEEVQWIVESNLKIVRAVKK